MGKSIGMKIPGKKLLNKAERTGNQAEVPMTESLGAVDFIKKTFQEAGKDNLAAFAANLAYQGLFAIFPFMLFLLSLLGIFNATGLVNELLARASTAMPQESVALIQNQILGITQSRAKGAFTVGAVIAALIALWSVSGAFRAIMIAMDVMYGVEESRPLWKRFMISIVLSLAVTALLLTALVLIVFGSSIGGAIADIVGLGEVFRWTWNILQWPVLALLVLFSFALIYYFAPDVKQNWRWISPGSLIAFALWLLFSLLFSLYVNTFGSYNATYGALAGVAILMLYMYYSSFILLLGAEMNQVIEEHIPGGKDEGEKTTPEVEQGDTGSTNNPSSHS